MSKLPGLSVPLFKIRVEEKGRIKDIKEIVARIDGLRSCLNGQLVDLGSGVKGIVMGFDQRDVLVLILGDPGHLKLGREVSAISEPFQIPVGKGFVGRMVDMMGNACDQGEPVVPDCLLPVMRESPPITARASVDEMLATGTKIVDMIVPIAKGQRQLIVGDRMTGKTTIAVDAIINQKSRNMICIYCCLGKSLSALEKVVNMLQQTGAMAYTLVMVATDSAPVGEQYLIPFATATMADYFAAQGRDVLVVFDDLTKHAWAYRQLSLLLDRPPGREAYPGDIFYVQTQLMERAGRFCKTFGGGSVTFLAIAETLQGDMTGYIPSNLSSMCDGQVCMSTSLFAEGFRPAIDFGLSLSIIGGKVQPPILRSLGQSLRADFARYSEIIRLSKLQTGLSGDAERIVRKGGAMLVVLQQGAYRPVPLVAQVLALYGLQRDWLSSQTTAVQSRFRDEIHAFALDRNPRLLQEIQETMTLTPEVDAGLADLMKAFFGGQEKG